MLPDVSAAAQAPVSCDVRQEAGGRQQSKQVVVVAEGLMSCAGWDTCSTARDNNSVLMWHFSGNVYRKVVSYNRRCISILRLSYLYLLAVTVKL